MKKSKQSKIINAPAVTHGSSDQAQGEWFRAEAEKFKRSGASVQGGKGSRPRTSPNSKAWRDNYDAIFKKN